ncbi:uncharacterized protein C7orf57 homolog isoform X2 [Xenia sp. Carnegie-2017]|uniref:uncharacterized protein C7orf57 homolog isoform X2 n=1 Tax=Xenia sp. Carnegie-2017 TaxID=2897299 RepID=UPI001F049127|nr:uncharacterized protein C7orf57 homolog isoform X2 [Xenia sp. Carnegie-2017]
MPNPLISTQDWFYHIPASRKSPEQSNNINAPFHSQIPGLNHNPVESIAEENLPQFKRKWIRDTDSKYVRLAKAGGRKNLLSFVSAKPSVEPVSYPRVDWFDHHQETCMNEEENNVNNEADTKRSCNDYAVLPEWYTHDVPDDKESTAKETNIPSNEEVKKRPMLGHDSMTVWERETKQDKDGKSRAMFVKLPKISKKSTKKNKTSNKYSALKLPNLDDDHSSPDNAEDMKKLLSMAYQQEWLAHKSAEYTQEMRNQMVLEKERRVREKRIAKRFRDSLKPKIGGKQAFV